MSSKSWPINPWCEKSWVKKTPQQTKSLCSLWFIPKQKEKKAMLCSLVSLLVALPIPSMIMPLAFGKAFKLWQTISIWPRRRGVDVWTAVQAYNFGPAYIDFIAQNGKENTLALAKQYSRDTVAPLLGNTTGKTYSYIHPISVFHGAELYVNGGNYYYSRQVQLNLYIIKCFTLFSTSG